MRLMLHIFSILVLGASALPSPRLPDDPVVAPPGRDNVWASGILSAPGGMMERVPVPATGDARQAVMESAFDRLKDGVMTKAKESIKEDLLSLNMTRPDAEKKPTLEPILPGTDHPTQPKVGNKRSLPTYPSVDYRRLRYGQSWNNTVRLDR